MYSVQKVNSQLQEKKTSLLASEVITDQLPNGIKVFVKQVYPARVASLAVWVKVGSVNESDQIAGISHFIEHMLFKGTKKRAVGEIAREIHGCGGYMNAFTDYECTCYWIVLPSKYLNAALDVQADAFLHSAFDETELHKECQVIIEELKMYEDRPESFSFEKLMPLAYKKHPYGRPIIGFEETLRAATRQDLLNYFQNYYHGNNMFIALIGDVEPSRAIRKIKSAFKSIPASPVNGAKLSTEAAQQEFRKEEFTGDIARTYMQMGFHIPEGIHEDLYPLRVLATLLGEGHSSRLHESLREKRQWVDVVQAGLFSQRDPGLFYLSLVLDDVHVQHAENGIWEELQRLQQEAVSSRELLKAQNMTESDYIFSQETVEGQGRILGYYEMLGDYKLGDQFLEKLFTVTPSDIQRTAQKYFARENCSEIVYHSRG